MGPFKMHLRNEKTILKNIYCPHFDCPPLKLTRFFNIFLNFLPIYLDTDPIYLDYFLTFENHTMCDLISTEILNKFEN